MKKVQLIILLLIMLITTELSFTVKAADFQDKTFSLSELNVGDTFQMGNYPQTLVKDSKLIDKLNKINSINNRYNYIESNSDFGYRYYFYVNMYWTDVSYNGELFRRVTINEYRPYCENGIGSSDFSYQDDNGYYVGNTYYFKWEPIVWIIYSKDTSSINCLSKSILDSGFFDKDNFYSIGFSESEKDKIKTVKYEDDGNEVIDKTRLLSMKDIKTYGTTILGKAKGTDYAKAQGLKINSNNDYSPYKLRYTSYYDVKAGQSYSGQVCFIDEYGDFDTEVEYGKFTYFGIRPSLTLSADKKVSPSEEPIGDKNHYHDFYGDSMVSMLIYKEGYKSCAPSSEKIEPTCTEDGFTAYTCTICGYVYKDNYVKAIGHKIVTDPAVSPSCNSAGLSEGKHCSVCGTVIKEQTEIPATGKHTPAEAVRKNEVEATCTKEGSYDNVVYCSVCGTEISREKITVPKTEHKADSAVKENEVEATCTQEGSYDSVVYCKDCGVELSRTKVRIPVIPHTPVVIPAQKPTYFNNGKTQGRACAVCGKILTAQKSVNKLKLATPSKRKAKAKKKAFTFSWKRNKNASGYIIQYSTSKKFTKKTTKQIKIKNNKTTSKTVKKLNKKKTYYIRIRAYEASGNKTVYSSWSKAVKVKTK